MPCMFLGTLHKLRHLGLQHLHVGVAGVASADVPAPSVASAAEEQG